MNLAIQKVIIRLNVRKLRFQYVWYHNECIIEFDEYTLSISIAICIYPKIIILQIFDQSLYDFSHLFSHDYDRY